MLVRYLNPNPWQKLNNSLLTLVSVEQAPRKAVQSYSGFAVQRCLTHRRAPALLFCGLLLIIIFHDFTEFSPWDFLVVLIRAFPPVEHIFFVLPA